MAASVAGTDSFSEERVRGASPSPARVRIQRPPALSAGIAVPASVATGTSFTVAMTVANAGEAPALGVAPGRVAARGRSGEVDGDAALQVGYGSIVWT